MLRLMRQMLMRGCEAVVWGGCKLVSNSEGIEGLRGEMLLKRWYQWADSNRHALASKGF
jgi:hypothetical protein